MPPRPVLHAAPLSPIPKTYRSALADPNWRAAMDEEFRTLQQNSTWELVPRSPRANIVTGKWIFKHKFRADSSLERYKARWVLRGFSQHPGVDFDETFSPVVKPATVRSSVTSSLSPLAHSSTRREECIPSWDFVGDRVLLSACWF